MPGENSLVNSSPIRFWCTDRGEEGYTRCSPRDRTRNPNHRNAAARPPQPHDRRRRTSAGAALLLENSAALPATSPVDPAAVAAPFHERPIGDWSSWSPLSSPVAAFRWGLPDFLWAQFEDCCAKPNPSLVSEQFREFRRSDCAQILRSTPAGRGDRSRGFGDLGTCANYLRN